jgi:cell division protein FtsA
MQEINDIEVGLDLGSSAITLVLGSKNSNNQIELLGYSKESNNKAIEKGSVVYLSQCNNAINHVLDSITMFPEHKHLLPEVGSVIVNMSSHEMVLEQAMESKILGDREQEVKNKDLEGLIQDLKKHKTKDGKFLLHSIAQEFTIDTKSMVYNPVGMQGNKLMVDSLSLILPEANRKKVMDAMPLLPAKNHKQPEKIAVEKFLHSGLAAGLAVLSPSEQKVGIAQVDIGDQLTNVVVYHNKIVRHVVTLPIGTQFITHDLMEAFGILEEQAILLKETFGVANMTIANNDFVEIKGINNRGSKEVSVKNVALVIEERLKEIAALVWFEIKKSGYSEKLGAGVVLTGGGANIQGIDAFWSTLLEQEVNIGEPYINLAPNQKNDFTQDPANAVAIGLLLSGFKSYDERRTPYIEEQAQEEKKKSNDEASKNGGFFTGLFDSLNLGTKNILKKRKLDNATEAPKEDKAYKKGTQRRFLDGLRNLGDMDDEY